MKELLDDIHDQQPKEQSPHLKNIKRNIVLMFSCLVSSISVMTLTKNAKDFSRITGTSENFAFVSIITIFLVGAVFFVIVVYNGIRYFVAKRR